MGDYYVDFASGDDGTGDGSFGDPWLTLGHAIETAQVPDAEHTIHVIGGADSNETNIEGSDRTNTLTIKPYTGYETSGASSWALRVYGSTRYNGIFRLKNNHEVEGIHFENTYTASSPAICGYVDGANCEIRRCKLENDFAGPVLDFSNQDDGCVIENSLLICNNSSGTGITSHKQVSDLYVRNNVIVGAATGYARDAAGNGTPYVTGNLFYNCTTELSTESGEDTNFDYNATTNSGDPTYGSNWVKSVSTTAGVDIVDASADDYRGVASGVLDNADGATTPATEDFEKTARPIGAQEDIGYYEIPAAGGLSIPVARHHYSKNLKAG